MKRSSADFAMVCCVCASLAVTQSHTESDSPRRLVTLTVAATDAKGGPVLDLRPADVRIREDGTALPVIFFRSSWSGMRVRRRGPASSSIGRQRLQRSSCWTAGTKG
jgi:hypothetical protein